MGLETVLVLAVKVGMEILKGFFGIGKPVAAEVVDAESPVPADSDADHMHDLGV